MRGFTLIELLIVVFIIGIVTSLAVLAPGISGREARLEREAMQLHARLKLASEEAVLRSEEFGLELEPSRYQFLRFEDPKWVPYVDDVMRTHDLPPDLTFDVILEGRRAKLDVTGNADVDDGKGKDGDKKNRAPAPEMVFLSSGEYTPFELTLSDTRSNIRYVIKGNGFEVTRIERLEKEG